MINFPVKSVLSVSVASAIGLLSGCAALQTAVEHRNLDVNSKMSNSIFLDPVSPDQKRIYVAVKNTSSQQNIGLKNELKEALAQNGWSVTNDFTKAHDRVQVNILQVGKAKNANAVYASLSNGFGGALAGGLLGSAIASGAASGAIAGGAIGAGAGWISGMLVKNVTYSMITDVQVAQRTEDGALVTTDTKSNLAQGNSGTQTQSMHTKSNFVKYRTRIASTANKVNLDFNDAKPVLAKQMAHEIAGIF